MHKRRQQKKIIELQKQPENNGKNGNKYITINNYLHVIGCMFQSKDTR